MSELFYLVIVRARKTKWNPVQTVAKLSLISTQAFPIMHHHAVDRAQQQSLALPEITDVYIRIPLSKNAEYWHFFSPSQWEAWAKENKG